MKSFVKFRRSIASNAHVVLALLLTFITMSTSLVAQDAAVKEKPYARDMRDFRMSDSLNKPAKGLYLFVGSSSIRMWDNLAQSFPNKKTLNRGFGGSTIPDVIENIETVIYPYNPKHIVIYVGENDIAQGVSADETLKRFTELYLRVRERFPTTPITYISIKPSPSRDQFKSVVQEANRLISDYIAKQKNIRFLDVYSRMLNDDGSYKPIYLEDQLHMNQQGYEIWRKALEQSWK